MSALLGIALLAFVSGYMDAALGMGYGTILTPLLLILGFKPLEVVPAVLLSQLVVSLTASFFHHRFGNVNFKRGSSHLNVALALALSGIVGSVAAVFVAINIPQLVLEVYIGLMVLAIGIVMLVNMHKDYGFSWKRIAGVGLVAAFNKGISGWLRTGGYGWPNPFGSRREKRYWHYFVSGRADLHGRVFDLFHDGECKKLGTASISTYRIYYFSSLFSRYCQKAEHQNTSYCHRHFNYSAGGGDTS